MADLHADGDIGFSKEYEAIQAASAQEHHPAEHSQHPENKQKNRYLNIVACGSFSDCVGCPSLKSFSFLLLILYYFHQIHFLSLMQEWISVVISNCRILKVKERKLKSYEYLCLSPGSWPPASTCQQLNYLSPLGWCAQTRLKCHGSALMEHFSFRWPHSCTPATFARPEESHGICQCQLYWWLWEGPGLHRYSGPSALHVWHLLAHGVGAACPHHCHDHKSRGARKGESQKPLTACVA